MATPATRQRAIDLYRRILRASYRWKGPPEERAYIRDEARTLFRENRNIGDTDLIEKKIFEGESRLELGLHYGIPYPRLHNLPTGTVLSQKEPLHEAGDEGDDTWHNLGPDQAA